MALQLPTKISDIDENRAAQIAAALQAEEDGTELPAAEPAAEELPAEPAGDIAPETPVSEPQQETRETEPAQPAIEPPLSWTAEEKDTFRELPPKVQQVVARRESERERAAQMRLQEAAEKSKAIEQERLRLAREADTYIQLAQMADPIIAEGARTDWVKLSRENPAECQAKWHEYQARTQSLNYAIQQRQAALDEQHRQAFERGQEKLIESFPDWRDADKRREGTTRLYRVAAERYGYNTQELSNLVDHRSIRVLADAAAYHDLLAKQSSSARQIVEKRVAPVTRTVRPGREQDVGSSDHEQAKAIRKQAATTRDSFKRAALIAQLIKD